MDRLTERHYLASDYYMKCSEECNVDMDCIDCPAFEHIVDKLGAYEDTGLTPELCKEQPTWISVTDKTQIPPERFLAITRFNDKIWIMERRGWGEADWLVGGYYLPKDVRWWMPLPEPPEEDEP